MSVREGTRAKRSRDRGKGIKRMVESKDQKIANWERFIALGENKASLANFLCTQLKTTHLADSSRELILSGGFVDAKEAWSSTGRDMSSLSSNHEEAATRIILHAQDASLSGFKQVNVICRDTDVIVLLVAHLPRICEHVWMQAGTAKKKRYIPIHKIDITDEIRASLLACHALSGCDTTSQFVGIGKQTAWKTFVTCPHLLEQLGEHKSPAKQVLDDAEAFVCKLYDSTTKSKLIPQIRSASFRAKKNIDLLPPTQDALHQHISRANYQTYIWKKAVEPCPCLPLPEQSGWLLVPDENVLKPRLITSEPISAACLELTTCGCSASEMRCATRRCKCIKLNLACTKACACTSVCSNPKTLDN